VSVQGTGTGMIEPPIARAIAARFTRQNSAGSADFPGVAFATDTENLERSLGEQKYRPSSTGRAASDVSPLRGILNENVGA